MPEQVQTGGVMSFKYDNENQRLDERRKKYIELGYEEADERRKQQRKNKIITWILIALVILIILGYFLLKK